MTRQASDAAERALWEGDQGDASVGGEFFDSVRGEFDKEEMKRRNNTNGMRRSLMMGMRMKLRSPKQPQEQQEQEHEQEEPSVSPNDMNDNNHIRQKPNRRAVFRLRALRRKKKRGSYMDPSLHAVSTAGESILGSYQNEFPNQPQSFSQRQQQQRGRRRQQEQQEDYCLKEQEPTMHIEENAGNVTTEKEEEEEEEDAVRDSIRSCRRDVAGHNLMVRMGGVRRFSVLTAEDEDESQRSEWLPRSIRPVPPTILERAVSDLTEIPHEYENPRKRLQQAHFTRQVGFRGLGKDSGGGADDDDTDVHDWSSTDSSQQSADYPYSPRPRHLPLDIELVQHQPPSLDNVPSTFTQEDDEILKRLGPPSKKLSLISDDGSDDTVTLPDAFVFAPPPTAAPATTKTKAKATTTSTTMRNSTMGLSSPDYGQHSLDPVINEDTSMEFGLPKRVGGQILEPEHAVRDWRSAVRKEQQQQQQQQESGSSSSSILVVNAAAGQPTPNNLVVSASQFSIHPRRKKLQHVRVSQLTRIQKQPQPQKQHGTNHNNNVHYDELVWEPSVVVANQSDSEDDYDLDEILAAAAVAQSTASFNRVQSDGVQPVLPPKRTNHNQTADANEARRLPPPDKATPPPPPPKLSPRLQEDASPSFSMRVPSRSGRHSLTIGTSSS